MESSLGMCNGEKEIRCEALSKCFDIQFVSLHESFNTHVYSFSLGVSIALGCGIIYQEIFNLLLL